MYKLPTAKKDSVLVLRCCCLHQHDENCCLSEQLFLVHVASAPALVHIRLEHPLHQFFPYSEVVITLDFESSIPGSNPGKGARLQYLT
jgi:hypothetical protein